MVSTGDDAPRNQPDPQRFSAVNQRVRLCSERLYVAATQTRQSDAEAEDSTTTSAPAADKPTAKKTAKKAAKKATARKAPAKKAPAKKATKKRIERNRAKRDAEAAEWREGRRAAVGSGSDRRDDRGGFKGREDRRDDRGGFKRRDDRGGFKGRDQQRGARPLRDQHAERHRQQDERRMRAVRRVGGFGHEHRFVSSTVRGSNAIWRRSGGAPTRFLATADRVRVRFRAKEPSDRVHTMIGGVKCRRVPE